MIGGRTGSLQARLVLILGLAIGVAAVAEVGLAYRAALHEADLILDGIMQRTAWSLRAGTILEDAGVPPGALPGLGGDAGNYDVYVQVWSADGLRAFRSDARVALPREATLGFADVRANGTTYRVYSLPAGSHLIQVAQDLGARRLAAGTLALRTVTPILFLAPLLLLVTVWVVRRSLAPVARVRRQVALRQPDDLTAVGGAEELPEEIRPLVEELNLLLGRVGRAFAAQQHFVADAAHELRSPLAAIKLQLQGLQRAADGAARAVAIERLGAGIDRATRLVEQLLVLARQEARITAAEPSTRVSLAEIARAALAEIAPSAQARRIDIGLARADPGPVQGHEDALRILLRNLLDNAVKYTPEGGAVDVEVREEDAVVVLGVEDSGPGIPPAERAAALERFRRGAHLNAPGSGLGLAIVRTIVELHGAALKLGDGPRRGGLWVEIRFARAPG